MMLAVTSAESILYGLTASSFGLLALSAMLLTRTLARQKAIQTSARVRYKQVEMANLYLRGPEATIAATRMHELVHLLRAEVHRESPRDPLPRRGTASTHSQPDVELQTAAGAALAFTIDELAFLKPEEEADVATVVAFHNVAKMLEREVARVRVTVGFG